MKKAFLFKKTKKKVGKDVHVKRDITKILFAYFNCSRSASIALRASKSQRSFSVWPAAEAQRYYPYGENVFQTGHYPCGDNALPAGGLGRACGKNSKKLMPVRLVQRRGSCLPRRCQL